MRSIIWRAVVSLLVVLAVNSYSQSTEDLMSSGGELLRSGAYGQAVTQFRKVLARDPGNFEAQFNVALSYLLWQRYNDAIQEFNKAAGINPRSSEVWANLGVAYERLGQTGKAIDCLVEAVNLNPGNIEARVNLASMYANMDRANEAINQFKEVVMIDGSNTVALTNLAKLLVGEKKIDEAKHYLREVIAFDPNSAEAYWVLGNIYRDQEKNFDEAVKKYNIAIKLEPNSPAYYQSLALLYEEQDKVDEAIEVYEDGLVYIDDALKKEKIQERIIVLKNSDSGAKAKSKEIAFEKENKEEVNRLKQELRGSEEKEETKTMDVGTFDIMSDLEGIGGDESDQSSLFDLKEEAKKKAKEKE
ncbi:MAG: tetratricopeptide repeat protein [Chitinivibrionales bacterium]|nr:tetratricopeptide repeat protein [Chitinivibrionales bacterium]